MMALMFGGIQADMLGHLKKTISACEAVKLGIATHAEKEHCAREAAQNRKRTTQRLMTPVKPTGG